MANPEQVEILRQGVKVWNQWRKDNPHVRPDLKNEYLGGMDLSVVNFHGTELSRVNLSGTDLSYADLREALISEAILSGANLIKARLINAYLFGTDLSDANLTGAYLGRADLRKANLTKANINGADMTMATLINANLSYARLLGANLREANLTMATLKAADIREASLRATRLIRANLDGANLTKAHLWESQRSGWSIRGVICESAYWDEKRKEETAYGPSEFERLFAERIKVKLFYKNGITSLEIATLPSLILHLEASKPQYKLRFQSIKDEPGGAIVEIVIDNSDDFPTDEAKQVASEIKLIAENYRDGFRLALEQRDRDYLRLEARFDQLQKDYVRLAERLIIGAITVNEYKTEIKGNFQGALGEDAQAHHLNYTEIGSRIEQSMDMSALAGELETLRQALKKKAVTEDQDRVVADIGRAKKAAEEKDSSKVAESLQSAGKWALDAATKIGTALATEAIKEAMGMK